MNTRKHAGQGGFTYFMLLWWVALSGIMLAALSQQWRFERRREKEAEMVARAQEIVSAIATYRQAVPNSGGPASLQDLVEDRRGPRTLRHLRRIWVDPLTGRADWGLVREAPGQPTTASARAATPAAGARGAAAAPPASSASSPFGNGPSWASASSFSASTPGIGGASSAEGGIHGIYSTASGTPIRAPAGTKTYEEWRFEAPVAANGP
jgi:type II secretory pathway pseudopilin PulG